MRTVQDILFGVAGQSLFFDAPEGRPTSVESVDVRAWDASDDDDEEFALVGAVELHPNTILMAAAGASQADPRRVEVNDVMDIGIGRTYLISSATTGVKEWLEVASVDLSDTVIARHPLHNDYATGLFQTTRISAAVDNSWAADDSNILEETNANPMYRVRWVYVVDGANHVADTYFNLVRYGARHNVRPENVEAIRAGWLDSLPKDHRTDQGRRLIDEAYREVKFDIAAVELDDADIAHAELVDNLVRYKTVELTEWSRFLGTQESDQNKHLAAEAQYTKRLNQFLRFTTKAPIRNADGSASRSSRAVGVTKR